MSVSKFFSVLTGPFFWQRGHTMPTTDRVRVKYLLARKHYGNTRSAVHQQDLKKRIRQRLETEHGKVYKPVYRVKLHAYRCRYTAQIFWIGGSSTPHGMQRVFPWGKRGVNWI